MRIGIDTDAQESPILSCSDGSVPDAITGLCADGFAPQSNLSELPSTVPDSAVLAGDNVTDISNITASQLLNENEVVSGEINSSAPAPEEIQMDTNGDGVVDETESQNQPAITGNAVPSEEIQMDTNGDGVVDETESQNQPAITGNAVPSEEIQMDTNGDGVVDETESQNTAGSNAGVQGSGGPRSQTQCEGDLAVEFPLARKTLDLADQNAKDFVRLLQAGGGIKQFPSTNLYWFAKLYSGTTYLELRDLKNVEHPAMVAHFIPIFLDSTRTPWIIIKIAPLPRSLHIG